MTSNIRRGTTWALGLTVLAAALITAWPGTARSTPAPKPAPAAPPAALDLRPHFVAGRTARYRLWSVQDRSVSAVMNGETLQSGRETHEFNGEATWKVEKVAADGSATCVLTLDWITVTLSADDEETQYNDSRKGTGDTEGLHTAIRAMTGMPLRFEVAADGTVRKVSGVDAIRKKAGGDAQVFEEEEFIEIASELAIVPGSGDGLVIGKFWDTAFDWKRQFGTLHLDRRYTVANYEEIAGIPVATITSTAKLKLEPDLSKLPKGPDAPKVDMKMTDASNVSQTMVDLHRHEVVAANVVEKMTVTINLRSTEATATTTMIQASQSQVLRIAEQ